MSEAEAEIVNQRSEPSGRGPGSPSIRLGALAAAALLGAAGLGACASQPKPTAQLVRASTLVGEAEKNEAQRYAAADLQRARDELSSAQTAESDGKYDNARGLADRAAADANLASARAASGKAGQSADQVRHSIDTLKQQLQQSPNPSGASGSGQDQQ
ncbi:MAG: DUF4398 domain-containing protein [Steroidobacteraceae bacterium]